MTALYTLAFIAAAFLPVLCAWWTMHGSLERRLRADRVLAAAKAQTALTQPAYVPECGPTLAPPGLSRATAANDRRARRIAA